MQKRLDIIIKEKYGYSREYAKEIIKDGYVFADDICIKKPSFSLDIDSKIRLDDRAIIKYVSRGGKKLEKAISYFDISITNKVCLDIGASTGGFSDCLLQSGASIIYAVDTGTKQLHEKIRKNDKINSFENTDIRNFNLYTKVDFICIDVSFISIIKIMEKALSLLSQNGDMIILIKPQFEVGQKNINKKGVVKNKKEHIRAINNINIYIKKYGFYIKDMIYSPITGGSGNIEYLAYIKRGISMDKNFKEIVELAFLNFYKGE